jgi:hypothetical protein
MARVATDSVWNNFYPTRFYGRVLAVRMVILAVRKKTLTLIWRSDQNDLKNADDCRVYP